MQPGSWVGGRVLEHGPLIGQSALRLVGASSLHPTRPKPFPSPIPHPRRFAEKQSVIEQSFLLGINPHPLQVIALFKILAPFLCLIPCATSVNNLFLLLTLIVHAVRKVESIAAVLIQARGV